MFSLKQTALTSLYNAYLQRYKTIAKTQKLNEELTMENNVVYLKDCITSLFGCPNALNKNHPCSAIVCLDCHESTVKQNNKSTNNRSKRPKRAKGKVTYENVNNRKHHKSNKCTLVVTSSSNGKCPCNWPQKHDWSLFNQVTDFSYWNRTHRGKHNNIPNSSYDCGRNFHTWKLVVSWFLY